MKTKTWTPPPASSAAAGFNAAPDPARLLMTPLYFISEQVGSTQTYELVSACYQVWRHLQDKHPFKLTLDNGQVMAALQNGEVLVDDAFKTALSVFDGVMTMEVKKAVTTTIEHLNAQVEKRRLEQQLQSQAPAEPTTPAPVLTDSASAPAPAVVDQPAEKVAQPSSVNSQNKAQLPNPQELELSETPLPKAPSRKNDILSALTDRPKSK